MRQIASATGSGSAPLQSDRARRAELRQSNYFAPCHLRGLGDRWRHRPHSESLNAISCTRDCDEHAAEFSRERLIRISSAARSIGVNNA
jgi:hypothetical protein